jgi:hypothetical protein
MAGKPSKEQAMIMPDTPTGGPSGASITGEGVPRERSTGELFGQLGQDLVLLVQQEAHLAKAEVQATVSRAIAVLVSLAAGGLVALMGALALAAASVLLLVDPVGLEPWLAALLVGLILATAGYALLRGGLRDLRAIDPAPRRAVRGIKEDIRMLKERRP